jgi:predicted TIM-barrel fold metal-dependent hydrolase
VIVDTQVHFWEADRPDRPYNGISEPNLPHPFGPEQMLPLMDEAGVDRVVIVPPGFMDPHNDYALECAERYPDRFAVMGLLLPGAPGSAERVEGWLQQPGMLGVRTHVNDRQRARWGSDAAAEPFWAACERYEVPVAVFVAGATEYVEALLKRYPALRLVLDHLGLPQIDVGLRREDLEPMRRLSRYPGVVVKLSTLPARSTQGYPFPEVHEAARVAYEEFGPERMLWATDHTQTLRRGRAAYAEELRLWSEALDFLTAEDRESILGGAACEHLGWPADTPSTALASVPLDERSARP